MTVEMLMTNNLKIKGIKIIKFKYKFVYFFYVITHLQPKRLFYN